MIYHSDEGIIKISLSTKLNLIDTSVGFLSFLLSIMIIICGIYITLNEGIVVATIGYLLVTFSIINIIESVIFKHNLSKIEKYLNEKNN